MSEPRPLHHRRDEDGVALILAILFTIIVIGVTVAGTLILRSHQTKTKVNFVSHGQSMQFAHSGLIEALGWFRKQTSQPVLTFNPVLDTTANPQRLETIDPAIGIVREFKITGSVWGRYEVWKDWAADPNPTRLAWRNLMKCRDYSDQRGNLSPGSVWKIRSIGYVYRLVDSTRAYNQAPNQVIGQEVLEVEARRLALQPPGQAALCTRTASTCSLQSMGRVLGGSAAAGVFYQSGTGSVTLASGSQITGTPTTSGSATYNDSLTTVFGATLEELKAMADYVVNTPNDFPSPVPINTLVVAETPMTFNATRPLSGTGVVIIAGNVLIDVGSYSSFSGLLYVQGNLTLRQPSEIQGAVVVTGSVTVQGQSDSATITYDDGILNRLRQKLGTYRLSGAVSRPMATER